MAMSVSRLLTCLPALSLALSVSPQALLAQSRVPQHPLDGLTSSEYWAVHDILHKSGHMTPDTGVSTLLLHEPLKSTVLAWKPGDPIEREADVILEDKGQTIEARVDITAGKLESWNVMPGVQAPFTTTELHAFSDLIKSDPRVLAAFKKRDLTDLSTIHCGAGPLALRVFPEQEHMRIGYGGCTDADGQYHTWGRNIEGLWVVVDITGKKVLQVIDTGVIPTAKYVGNFEEAAEIPREGTKPIVVIQPMGPSFKIDKGEITWQNWHFRLRLDSRVGPVLNLVSYQDGEKLRSVLYEGSFSEMYVPYMDTDEGWNSRSFLDAGEFTRDGLLREIDEDDCPAHAQFISGLSTTDSGTPLLRLKEACLFERAPGDPAWRHNENGIMAGRPSRELVLRAAAAIGNYDYMMDWIFQQDGTIRVRVGATGIVEVKGSKDTVVAPQTMTGGMPTPEQGTLVAPNTVAVYHDHYLCFRLDLDVDGQSNSFMVDRLVPRKIQARTRTSIWGVEPTLAKSESEGILDIDPRKPAMWHFISATQKGPLGYPTGYEIMPEATAVDFLSPDDPSLKVGAFAEHQLWVTPYQPDERYAAGVYVTNSKGGEGLPAWTKADRPIENTDIVAWYTLGFHHVVRIEDWPVMPTLWHEFMIRPINFFSENPVMTLPHQP
jgi:primary-amine oxidase